LADDDVLRCAVALALLRAPQVWAKNNQIVAVKPNPAFANYFTAASEGRPAHPKADANSEVTMTGATGVEAAFVASRIEIRL
jgi:hypothetical protein